MLRVLDWQELLSKWSKNLLWAITNWQLGNYGKENEYVVISENVRSDGLHSSLVRVACRGEKCFLCLCGCTWEGSLIEEAPWFLFFSSCSFRRGSDNALMINWVYAGLLNSIFGGKSPPLFLANVSHHGEFKSGHLCGPVDIWNKSALAGQDPFRITAPPRGQSLDEWFITGRIKCSLPAEIKCMRKPISGKTIILQNVKICFAQPGLDNELNTHSAVNAQDDCIGGGSECEGHLSLLTRPTLNINLLQYGSRGLS